VREETGVVGKRPHSYDRGGERESEKQVRKKKTHKLGNSEQNDKESDHREGEKCDVVPRALVTGLVDSKKKKTPPCGQTVGGRPSRYAHLKKKTGKPVSHKGK